MTDERIESTKKYAWPSWLSRQKQRRKVAVRKAVWRIIGYLATHPKWYIRLFRITRFLRPVMVFSKFVLVTRHKDVNSVLSRDTDFSLAEFSEERMMAGSFLLNIDWPDQHNRESAAVMKAMHVVRETMQSADAERIRTIAAKRCETIIGKANGEIDIPRDLAEHVAVDVVENYFGVQASDNGERKSLITWLRHLASAILTLPPHGTIERAQVEHAAQQLFNLTGKLVSDRIKQLEDDYEKWSNQKIDRIDKDDVLTRLAKRVVTAQRERTDLWLNEDWARRMISGLVVFGNATVARTATDTLDELLNRPLVLEEARRVARESQDESSDSAAEPDKRLKHYIYEALRFRPMLPVLFRYCPRPTVVANTNGGGRRIPGGANVVAPPIAAMFDKSEFPDPYEFKSDRCLKKYLLFGAGMHRCTGQFVADAELVEIVKAVLALPGLRRSAGKRGEVNYEAAAAKSLFLSFDQ